MSGSVAAGFYGKMPQRGDFINRRLPRGFVDNWDQWLQAAMAASRTALGESWLETYLTSPIWRFVLAPGACGNAAWAGVLMPSVDRVGRYFPLTITVKLAAGCNPFRIAADPAARDWFARAEELVLSALDESGFDLEGFDAQVEQLGPVGPAAGKAEPESNLSAALAVALSQREAWHLPLAEVDHAALTYPDLAFVMSGMEMRPLSLWWTAGSDRVAPSLLVCRGLPPAEGFVGLLGGHWTSGPWGMMPLQPMELPTVAAVPPAAPAESEPARLEAGEPQAEPAAVEEPPAAALDPLAALGEAPAAPMELAPMPADPVPPDPVPPDPAAAEAQLETGQEPESAPEAIPSPPEPAAPEPPPPAIDPLAALGPASASPQAGEAQAGEAMSGGSEPRAAEAAVPAEPQAGAGPTGVDPLAALVAGSVEPAAPAAPLTDTTPPLSEPQTPTEPRAAADTPTPIVDPLAALDASPTPLGAPAEPPSAGQALPPEVAPGGAEPAEPIEAAKPPSPVDPLAALGPAPESHPPSGEPAPGSKPQTPEAGPGEPGPPQVSPRPDPATVDPLVALGPGPGGRGPTEEPPLGPDEDQNDSPTVPRGGTGDWTVSGNPGDDREGQS